MEVKETRSSGKGEYRSSYIVSHTFCPICKYEYSVKNKERTAKIMKFMPLMTLALVAIMAIPFLGFGLLDNISFDLTSPIIWIVLVFILITRGIFYVIKEYANSQTSQMVDKSTVEKEEFLETVENKEFLMSYQDKDQLICNQCGNGIPKTSRFCMNCGDSTEDELAELATRS